MTRALLLAVMCISATACANPRQAHSPVPRGTDWSAAACVQKGVAPLRCATLGQWHDEMQAHGKSPSIIAGALVGLANAPPGPTGAPTAVLPPNRPAGAVTTAPASSSVPDYTYAGPSILSQPDPVDTDDGPPPPRTVMTMPMGNGATIFAGDINGIALPMGNGTLYSFE